MMTDPVGDLLTRIRNAQSRGLRKTSSPASKLRATVLDVLVAEGYLRGYVEVEQDGKRNLEIELIEWTGGESPHREFIEAGREGMHHIRFRVEDTDHWVERLRPLGYEAVWYKRWSADTVFAYLERPGDPTLIEFLQMPPDGPGA